MFRGRKKKKKKTPTPEPIKEPEHDDKWLELQDDIVKCALAGVSVDYILGLDLECFYSLLGSVIRCKFSDLMYVGNTVRASQASDKDYRKYLRGLEQLIAPPSSDPDHSDADKFIRNFGTEM